MMKRLKSKIAVSTVYDTPIVRAGFTNRLYRLKPSASRSKGASSKLWYA